MTRRLHSRSKRASRASSPPATCAAARSSAWRPPSARDRSRSAWSERVGDRGRAVVHTQTKVSSKKHQRQSSPGSKDWTIGWPIRCACRRAWRPGDESQQPTWPHVRHRRRCTQGVPSRRHSSQPSGVRGTTGRISSRWVQITVARMRDEVGRRRRAESVGRRAAAVARPRGGSITARAMHGTLLAARDLTGALGRPSQHDMLAAREMQAMSFAVHIPLVCFGIAFPAMVLFVEGLWLRTGERTYRDLAQRWSKVMLVAVRGRGRHRDDPVLRARPAVAELHGDVRRGVRPGLRDRGLRLLHRGDLHRHLRLRLGPARATHAPRCRRPDRPRAGSSDRSW